ncbi:hypothetical protein quinque_005551, partial [Culex quinquefasciatus]
ETEGEVSGKLVYMTCSLNPNENESVLLAEMVEQCLVPTLRAKPWEPTTRTCKSRKTTAPSSDRLCSSSSSRGLSQVQPIQPRALQPRPPPPTKHRQILFIVLFEKKKGAALGGFPSKTAVEGLRSETTPKEAKTLPPQPAQPPDSVPRRQKEEHLLAQEGLQIVNGCIGAGWRTRILKDDFIKLLFKNDPEKPPEIEGLGEEGVGTVQMCVGVSADPFAVRNYYPPRRRFLTWA